MPLSSYLRLLLSDKGAISASQHIGVARVTVHSWLTKGTSHRLPSPRHLNAFLDFVAATPEQRIQAWQLLAEGNTARQHKPTTDRAAA